MNQVVQYRKQCSARLEGKTLASPPPPPKKHSFLRTLLQRLTNWETFTILVLLNSIDFTTESITKSK